MVPALGAPLLIGCDMADMDPFTLSLLTNDEVLAVSQDPLGSQAAPVWRSQGLEVWAKPLEDGSKAVGLFNRNRTPESVTAALPTWELRASRSFATSGGSRIWAPSRTSSRPRLPRTASCWCGFDRLADHKEASSAEACSCGCVLFDRVGLRRSPPRG